MRSVATDVVSWSVFFSACKVHTGQRAKTDEPVEMPFGGRLLCAQGTITRLGADWRYLANTMDRSVLQRLCGLSCHYCSNLLCCMVNCDSMMLSGADTTSENPRAARRTRTTQERPHSSQELAACSTRLMELWLYVLPACHSAHNTLHLFIITIVTSFCSKLNNFKRRVK